jgi:hypothetical protein
MKKSIKILAGALLITLAVFSTSNIIAQGPPPPPDGGHGQGGDQAPGGGASSGSGLLILAALGTVYLMRRWYVYKLKPAEEKLRLGFFVRRDF